MVLGAGAIVEFGVMEVRQSETALFGFSLQTYAQDNGFCELLLPSGKSASNAGPVGLWL